MPIELVHFLFPQLHISCWSKKMAIVFVFFTIENRLCPIVIMLIRKCVIGMRTTRVPGLADSHHSRWKHNIVPRIRAFPPTSNRFQLIVWPIYGHWPIYGQTISGDAANVTSAKAWKCANFNRLAGACIINATDREKNRWNYSRKLMRSNWNDQNYRRSIACEVTNVSPKIETTCTTEITMWKAMRV